MDKRLFKEIKRTDEKKIEDMLLQYIKTARKSFKCDIWQESLADERILTEDARCGDSTAQYLLSIYWLLKIRGYILPTGSKVHRDPIWGNVKITIRGKKLYKTLSGYDSLSERERN